MSSFNSVSLEPPLVLFSAVRSSPSARSTSNPGSTDAASTKLRTNSAAPTTSEPINRDAIAELPDNERIVIELAYWGGRSQSEIADLLQVPLGTVKTRTRTGLARLADMLEDVL